MFGFGGPTYDPKSETGDLKGKVALVTGGNSGIGLEIVKHLVSYGAKVYIASRSKERIQNAIELLRQDGSLDKGSVETLLIDLSLLKDVDRAAKEFALLEPKLHVLVNNAGVLSQPVRSETTEGLFDPLASNYLGHFLLTELLLPQLKAAAAEPNSDVRIVVNGSRFIHKPPMLHKLETLDDLDICKNTSYTNGVARYGLSKLCMMWHAKELQRRFDEEGTSITILVADPGYVWTPGVGPSMNASFHPILIALIKLIAPYFTSTPAVGALSANFASSSVKVKEDRENYKAALILPPNVITPWTGQAANPDRPKELYAISKQAVEKVLGE